MDVTPYLKHQIAPRALFDLLPARRSRVRFMVPTADGHDWHAVTWQAFADQVRDIGLFLTGNGLRASGDKACILAPNSVAWLAAALGIQAVGGVMVPIYPSSTADQMGYVIEHSDARFVFVDTLPLLERLLEIWPRLASVERIVLLDDELDVVQALDAVRERTGTAPSAMSVTARVTTWSRARQVGRALDHEEPNLLQRRLDDLSLDQAGMMLYTSGTTGRPKGVPLTHRNTGTNGTDWMRCNAPMLEEGQVDLLWLPMSHIFGFGEACLGNTLGWVSYLCDPVSVLSRMKEVRPNVFMSVPRYWEKLAASAMRAETAAERKRALDRATGGALRFCLSGGAGLKPEVKTLFHECGLLIVEGYGLTEASPTLTLNRPDSFRFDSVGKPLPSVELRLAEDGEILAHGPSIFGGYHKDAEATSATFTPDGWLKTGDIGRWTDDGFLQIIDRKKEILVTAGGKNVPPANIEMRFANDPLLAHVVVYGDGKPYLTAGVWLNREAVDEHLREQGVAAGRREEAIRALVQQRVDKINTDLPRHETVKRFVVFERPLTVENGLLTATLKVRRKKVYEAFGQELEALYG